MVVVGGDQHPAVAGARNRRQDIGATAGARNRLFEGVEAPRAERRDDLGAGGEALRSSGRSTGGRLGAKRFHQRFHGANHNLRVCFV